MKRIPFFLISLLFFSGLHAHEEPARTMGEVREKRHERERVQQLRIKSSIAWKYEVIDGASTGIRRKHLVSEYDSGGFLRSVSLFDDSGSLETRVVHQYDDDGNIRTVETFDGENRLTAKMVYQYQYFTGVPAGAGGGSRWHDKFRFIGDIPAVTFHYDHGVLAGSYPPGRETVEVTMEDVSAFLGHVCLCGAGGYRIAQLAADLLKGEEPAPEKGGFTLISGRDHTVSDVIAHVLGCSRRKDPNRSQYAIDESVEAPKREYHYFIAYAPRERAVHVIYRKHLLIGNELMDRLWKVETGYEEDPSSVSREEMDLYRETMEKIVRDVLEDKTTGLFEVRSLKYDEFLSRLERIKKESAGYSF